ncbi:hypothetical protein BC826DRAFT_1152664 [Russula brevipes]|nr:hypothetical protein BC826DRAFT_1152664 [Russula brevipes]
MWKTLGPVGPCRLVLDNHIRWIKLSRSQDLKASSQAPSRAMKHMKPAKPALTGNTSSLTHLTALDWAPYITSHAPDSYTTRSIGDGSTIRGQVAHTSSSGIDINGSKAPICGKPHGQKRKLPDSGFDCKEWLSKGANMTVTKSYGLVGSTSLLAWLVLTLIELQTGEMNGQSNSNAEMYTLEPQDHPICSELRSQKRGLPDSGFDDEEQLVKRVNIAVTESYCQMGKTNDQSDSDAEMYTLKSQDHSICSEIQALMKSSLQNG